MSEPAPSADLRFLLPVPIRSAVAIGGARDWLGALERAGIESGTEHPDLLVADRAGLDRAIAASPPAILAAGVDATRSLRRAGYRAGAALAVPDLDRPAAFVPLRDGPAGRYLLNRWLIPGSRVKAARNRAAAALLARGIAPARGNVVTVAARAPSATPLLARAAQGLGLAADVRAVLLPGQGDALARGAMLIFEPGADRPTAAIKFARVAGYAEQFDRDDRGLEALHAAGGPALRHAPRRLGRFVCEGVHASLETAAVGCPLIGFLHSPASRRAKLAALDRVLAWLIEVARASRAAPAALEPERARLSGEVLPAWRDVGAGDEIVAGIATVPAVLAHNDLGSWNVVVGDGGFCALDWEAARRHGLPLWDVLYLLLDALAHLDGRAAPAARAEHMRDLFAGATPSSRYLFRWTRRAADALGLDPDAVGALATLCWLHHGRSGQTRRAALAEQRGADRAPADPMADIARRWMADPQLGPGWDRWRAAA